MTKRKR